MVRFSIALCLALAGMLALSRVAMGATATGIVLEQGRPVVGAAVVVDGTEPIFTDQDGRYTAEVEAGERKIRVTLRGYRPIERVVNVAAEATATADFVLEPLLQLGISTAPDQLSRGASGEVQILATNSGSTDYAVEAAGLRVYVEGRDRTADFTVQPAAGNPTSIKAGETTLLTFTLTPTASAPTGQVTIRASLFAFDTALGQNLLGNASLEMVDAAGRPTGWSFGIDNQQLGIRAQGTIVTDQAMTGARSARIQVTESPEGDVRAYWGVPGNRWVAVKPGATYMLSGYVKTENVEAEQFGAAVYVPVVNDNPYQQPNAPWITGTRDWRKAIISFRVAEDADGPLAVPRGEIQQATGIAWFDNFSLTEGTEDASLTVTSSDRALEVTAG